MNPPAHSYVPKTLGLLALLSMGPLACSGDKAGGDSGGDGAADDGADGADGADDGADGDGDGGGDTADDGSDDDSADGAEAGEDGGEAGEGDDGTGGGDSGGFVDPPDGGVTGQCDPGLQDCPDEDEKCTTYVTMPGDCCVDSAKCVPITGSGQAGDDCTRTNDNDDCDKGLFCTTTTSGGTGMGFCEPFCVVGDPDTCAEACIPYNDGIHPLCRQKCDPLLQDCPTNLGCYSGIDFFVCGKPAHGEGEGQDGDPCAVARSCEPGLACVSGGNSEGCDAAESCCTAFCDMTGDPGQCPAATEECVAWFDAGAELPGLESLGSCAIPM